jgi:homopolymeric O-antigen transport system permease protein
MLADLVELVRYHQVLEELVKRELKARYKRSVLGLAWTMLNPLLTMAVTTLVFANLFSISIDNFPVYFLSAYQVWNLFAQGTSIGCTSVLSGATLARRVYLPPALFPLASVCAAVINLLLALLPLLLLMLLTGGHLSWALLSLPLAILLTAVFSCGVALLLSAATVFFHDTTHVYQVVLTLWSYLTPMFYPIEIVPARWRPVLELNPLFSLIQLFRAPIYAEVWPALSDLALASAWALGTLGLGWLYFERSRDDFISYF